MNKMATDVFDRMVTHLREGTTDLADSILHVPIANFTSKDHLKRELAVFRRLPLAAAMSSELGEANSFVTRDLLGAPVLIVRPKDGAIAAFRNMCRHRGGKVELADKGRKPFFVCGYHGWSYDGDGALRGVPFDDHLGGIDKSCNSLVRLACEERHGIVWVNLTDNVGSIADYLGDADVRLADYAADKTVIFMEQKLDVPINWKLVMDTFQEGYHVMQTHPQLHEASPGLYANMYEAPRETVPGERPRIAVEAVDIKKANINEGLESTLIITNNLLSNTIRVEKNYGNIPLIECYPGKLNQVFLNIISNGVYAIRKKFGDNDGGIVTITTSTDDTYLLVTIGDNGTGMDEQTKKRMFEPFFTTKEVGEGTGLGMSIAYNTINKHNGQIIINSELGKGTDFIIKLPLVQK